MTEQLNARVMLVDDEQDYLDALSARLEMRGMKVTAVSRGQEAVDIASDKKFDVILLDLAMPGMDGLETLKRIKENDPDAEIIILTGHGSVKAGVEAMKLGAEDFMEKPVRFEQLLTRIEEAQEKRVLVVQKEAKEEIENILHTKPW